MGYLAGAIVTFEPGVTLAAALRAQPAADPALTTAFAAHAHPALDLTPIGEPPLDEGIDVGHLTGTDLTAAVWPGMSILCSAEHSDNDTPSQLDLSLVTHPTLGRSVFAMYSVDSVGAAGFALWDPAGRLVRAISLTGSPGEHELHEDVGPRLAAEGPWWDDPQGYPPTLVKLVMLDLLGFDFDHEGIDPAPVDLDHVTVLTYAAAPRSTPAAASPGGPPALPLTPPASGPPPPRARRSWWHRS